MSKSNLRFVDDDGGVATNPVGFKAKKEEGNMPFAVDGRVVVVVGVVGVAFPAERDGGFSFMVNVILVGVFVVAVVLVVVGIVVDDGVVCFGC